jgi:hypothetical protein
MMRSDVRMRAWQRSCGATMGLALFLAARSAAAEPSGTERAAAETLFQQGTELLANKQYAQACEKFEGSQQLDPALGTLLRLADCYDRVGKTASAWTSFRDAASLAGSRNEGERQRIASERAVDLEKRMPKVELKMDPRTRPSGLEIRLNGANIPAASWDTPLPVDPGKQKIDATAPGRVPWSATIDILPGPGSHPIEVPALTVKPADSPRLSTAPASGSEQDGSSRGTTQRTIGYALGGVAVVGAGLGAFFGYRAYQVNQSSLGQCRTADVNACTSDGAELRSSARHWATESTLAFVAAGTLALGGAVLILSAKSSEPQKTALRLSGAPALNGGNVTLQGTW